MDFETEEIIKIVPIYKHFVENNDNFDINDNFIINNFKINYNQKLYFNKAQFIKIIKFLLQKCDSVKGRDNKIFIALIIYKFIFSDISFMIENKKFCDTIFSKMNEFKNNDYLCFDNFKQFTEENINPLDIWFEIYNKEILKQEKLDIFKKENLLDIINKTNNTIIDTKEIISTHPILNLLSDPHNTKNNNIKFIFKSTNEYTNEKFNDIIYTLLNNNNFNVITLLAMYEIIINNINYIKENEENKKKLLII